MDANAIRLTALSINDPGPEWFGAEGPAVARIANDYIAGIAAQAVVRCKQPVTYPSVVDEFLNRQATPALIFAVSNNGTPLAPSHRKKLLLIHNPPSSVA
jgi:hypothetical protein